MRSVLLLVVAFIGCVTGQTFNCMQVPIIQCCASVILRRCPVECSAYASANCPERFKVIQGRKSNSVAAGNSASPSNREPEISRHESGVGGAKAHAAAVQSKTKIEIPTGERIDEPTNCGNKENDYASCTDLETANDLFRSCCEQYVSQECHELCQYETTDLAARNLMVRVVKDSKCSLKNISPILYCASQNRDNRQCCEYLDLGAEKLNVGDRCLRMCDPAGEKLGTLTKEDLVCLGNWNVIMYCHQSGLRL